MTGRSRDYYRTMAIQSRPRDPVHDAQMAARSAAARARFDAALAVMPLIQQLNAAALAMQQNADMSTLPVTGC